MRKIQVQRKRETDCKQIRGTGRKVKDKESEKEVK